MLTDSEFKRLLFEARIVIVAFLNEEPCTFKAATVHAKLERLTFQDNAYFIEIWNTDEVFSRAKEFGIDLT